MNGISVAAALPEDQQEVLMAIQWGGGMHSVSAGMHQETNWYGCWFDFDHPIQEIFHGKVQVWMRLIVYPAI